MGGFLSGTRGRWRHLRRLAGDVVAFARAERAWWMVPLVAILLLAGLLIVVGAKTLPFLYTVF
jgi:hypothetical protein